MGCNMKRMFFPEHVNVRGTGFEADRINEVEETPGSINRWLIRGCTIVEDESTIEEAPVEAKEEEAPVEVEKKAPKTRAKRRTKSS